MGDVFHPVRLNLGRFIRAGSLRRIEYCAADDGSGVPFDYSKLYGQVRFFMVAVFGELFRHVASLLLYSVCLQVQQFPREPVVNTSPETEQKCV